MPTTPLIPRGHFTFTPIGTTTHVAIVGEICIQNRQSLKQQCFDEIERGQRQFVIDCAQCGYIDSSGLGVLVHIANRVRAVGGSLVLANLNEDLRVLMQLTRLDTLFEISESAR